MTNILRRMKKFAELNEESHRLPKYLIHKMTIYVILLGYNNENNEIQLFS